MAGSFPFPFGGHFAPVVAAQGAGEPGRNMKIGTDGNLVRVAGRLVRVGGIESIAQDIRCAIGAIQTFDELGDPNGEWFADFTIGIPLYRDILVKAPDLPRIGELFRRVVRSRKGVIDAPSPALTLTKSTRHLAVDLGTIKTDLGLLRGTIEGTL